MQITQIKMIKNRDCSCSRQVKDRKKVEEKRKIASDTEFGRLGNQMRNKKTRGKVTFDLMIKKKETEIHRLSF